jgi:lipopolysaccharide transport system ATP-binding protein
MLKGRALVAGDTTEEFWALKDVNFEVKRGEVVGIIGRNGAGKSTLLKILSRITEPTEGRVEIRGRVASLLEVGTGFHPELTGRENIYLNGAILGMSRAEIRRKFDEIVAFAEIEKFLDTPVKRYSSGMYVRLAFAVAAHLEPEILIVDEVLAVGDAEFQKKCLGKMQDVAGGGRTVLFVSHNMGAVSTLTERCLYLAQGRIAFSGETSQCIEEYLSPQLSDTSAKSVGVDFYRRNENPDAPVRISNVRMINKGGLRKVAIGDDIKILIEFAASRKFDDIYINIIIKNSRGEVIGIVISLDSDFTVSGGPGHHVAEVILHKAPLTPGRYIADIGMGGNPDSLAYDVLLNLPLFEVINEGAICHWLQRPWGPLHINSLSWSSVLTPRQQDKLIA